MTFLDEIGADKTSDEWKNYIKQTKIAALSDAKGFRIDSSIDENGNMTVKHVDLDGNEIKHTVPFLSPGLQDK